MRNTIPWNKKKVSPAKNSHYLTILIYIYYLVIIQNRFVIKYIYNDMIYICV